MAGQLLRRAAVAGSWYPADPAQLVSDLTDCLARVPAGPGGDVCALIAPHAGLMYSGPVAAYAYGTLRGRHFGCVVLVGPSHYVAFDGVSIWDRGAFETPLGPLAIDEATAEALMAASSIFGRLPDAHRREHSIEMQLPFLKHLLPDTPIVPLVMGYQRRETIEALGVALAAGLAGREALLVASTDLSHFFDAETAAALDRRVIECVSRLDADGLLRELERYPEPERGRFVACGGGPAVAVMQAARALEARDGRVLRYADSGDVSGDKASVVGYLAAAIGRFPSSGATES